MTRMERFAKSLNDLRAMPRILIGLYGYIVYLTVVWYMGLPDPSAPQTTFISIVFGAAAAWFGLYVNSGTNVKGDVSK